MASFVWNDYFADSLSVFLTNPFDSFIHLFERFTNPFEKFIHPFEWLVKPFVEHFVDHSLTVHYLCVFPFEWVSVSVCFAFPVTIIHFIQMKTL